MKIIGTTDQDVCYVIPFRGKRVFMLHCKSTKEIFFDHIEIDGVFGIDEMVELIQSDQELLDYFLDTYSDRLRYEQAFKEAYEFFKTWYFKYP